MSIQATLLQQIHENYAPVSPEAAFALFGVMKPLAFEKPEILVREGQHATDLYYVAKGGVRAFYLNDGRDITDWFAFENHFVCALTSYFRDVPSPHYLETLGPTELFAVSRKDIEELCDRFHDIERLARAVVTDTMLKLQERMVAMQFRTAAERYLSLLEMYPDIEQRAPLSTIATFLGITQETLSRIRSKKDRI